MRNPLGPTALLLVLAAAPLPAQTTGTVVLTAPSAQGCPVGLSARHLPGGGLVSVDHSAPPPDRAYTLRFAPAAGQAIAQARVTLRGFAGSHMQPAAASPAPAQPSQTSQTFTVSPAAAPGHSYTTVVYAARLAGVQWVELDELTYADGTRWQASSTAPCRIAPDGFLLVAGQ